MATAKKPRPTNHFRLTVGGKEAAGQFREVTGLDAENEIVEGRYRGPLHGVPIAHKDLYYTRGVLTTAGSRVFEDCVPQYDATTNTAAHSVWLLLFVRPWTDAIIADYDTRR